MKNMNNFIEKNVDESNENSENSMQKEEILLENFKDFKANLNEFYRNLVFVSDVFWQKKEEAEEELEKNIFEEKTSKLYMSTVPEIEELKQKIQNCFDDFNFNSSFDIYKTFTNLLETWQADLVLINSFSADEVLENNNVDRIFLFNLSFLEVLKIQTNIIKENIEKIILKTQNLIKKD